MYSFSFSESVWPRTIREMPAQEKNEMTPSTIVRLGLKIAASASASTMNGNASTVSMNLASTVSTQPPKYPATRPTLTPATTGTTSTRAVVAAFSCVRSGTMEAVNAAAVTTATREPNTGRRPSGHARRHAAPTWAVPVPPKFLAQCPSLRRSASR